MDRIDYFYFIIDVSKSMAGRKIGAVNDAVNNIVYRLKRFVGSRDLTFKIVSMTYADKPYWSNSIPVEVSGYVFSDLLTIGTESNLGIALTELNEKLLRQSEVDTEKGASTTIVIFSDGMSTDDIRAPLEVLKNNEMFVNSNRIAVTFDDELSRDIAFEDLGLLVNKEENIIVDDFVKLNKMLFEKYK